MVIALTGVSQTKRIDPDNYKNKARIYATLSAQYSKDAFFCAKKSFFSADIAVIKENCNKAVNYAQIAISYSDSAILVAKDTSIKAKNIMSQAKDNQLLAIEKFQQMLLEQNEDSIHNLSEASMHAIENAIVDAYKASLYFASAEKVKSETEEKSREATRSEADEASFMTAEELYDKRLKEIDEELRQLKVKAKNSSGEELEKINEVIAQLNREKEELLNKKKHSKNKLSAIRKSRYGDNKPLLYRVQIGLFKNKELPSYFKGKSDVTSEKVGAYYRHIFGSFERYKEAEAAKIKLHKKGYSGAFIVAYIYGKIVLMKEALKKEKQLYEE